MMQWFFSSKNPTPAAVDGVRGVRHVLIVFVLWPKFNSHVPVAVNPFYLFYRNDDTPAVE